MTTEINDLLASYNDQIQLSEQFANTKTLLCGRVEQYLAKMSNTELPIVVLEPSDMLY